MMPSQNCIDLIKKFEGLFLKSYLCPAGVPTIGYGSTMWNDGKKVVIGQTITLEGAEILLMWELKNKANALHRLNLNQNQFDALMSFIYNIGISAFLNSTLFKKALANQNDETIRNEFMRWNKAKVNGKMIVLKGLNNRRIAESNLYFTI
jgi:lysozyme